MISTSNLGEGNLERRWRWYVRLGLLPRVRDASKVPGWMVDYQMRASALDQQLQELAERAMNIPAPYNPHGERRCYFFLRARRGQVIQARRVSAAVGTVWTSIAGIRNNQLICKI